jgi:hypothetical protein
MSRPRSLAGPRVCACAAHSKDAQSPEGVRITSEWFRITSEKRNGDRQLGPRQNEEHPMDRAQWTFGRLLRWHFAGEL